MSAQPVHPAGRETDPGRRPPRPTAELASIAAVYVTAVTIAGTTVIRGERAVTFRPWDLAVPGLATHKLSRRISKDSVTSPLRAPFAVVTSAEGPGEVEQQVRGRGARRAVGELLTCPFCIGQWVATGFVFTHVLAPRLARLAGAVFATAAVADFLQFAYAASDQGSRGEEG